MLAGDDGTSATAAASIAAAVAAAAAEAAATAEAAREPAAPAAALAAGGGARLARPPAVKADGATLTPPDEADAMDVDRIAEPKGLATPDAETAAEKA